MSDARMQQIIAGVLAAICLVGYILLHVLRIDDVLLPAVVTLLVGFIIGNVKTNGVGGSKATQASDDLASRVATKVVAATAPPDDLADKVATKVVAAIPPTTGGD